MKSSKDIMQEASQLFAKLGQNVVIRNNLEKEAAALHDSINALEADYQAALKAEMEAAPSDAPAPAGDATGTP